MCNLKYVCLRLLFGVVVLTAVAAASADDYFSAISSQGMATAKHGTTHDLNLPPLLLAAETPLQLPAFVRLAPVRQVRNLYDDPAAHATSDLGDPHENTHQVNSQMRNAWERKYGGRWNAAYLLRDRGCMIQEPPGITLSMVAQAVPQQWRSSGYQLYLIQQARDWNDRSLYVAIDEFGAYMNGLECDISSATPHNDINFEFGKCQEFYRYALVTLQIVYTKCPTYDRTQLDAVIKYQGQRLTRLQQRPCK